MVLFDEVEKAHPQVFNTFLQILDDGRLTDGRGRIVNFKNTILILTSNLGSELYTKYGENDEKNKGKRDTEIMDIVKKFFRPEFINRLDAFIFFNALDQEMISRIVDIQIQDIAKRFAKQSLHFEMTEALKKHLRVVGFDPLYGARPLKRVINELVVDEVALQIIEGKIKPGDTILADYKGNKISLTVKKPN